MRWIIQDNLYNEDGYVRLIKALDRLNQTYDVVKVVPFSHELMPDVDYDEPVIVMGSDSLIKAAERKGWKPGAFTGPNFDYREWRRAYGDELLNPDGQVLKFGEITIPDDHTESFFIRPVFDFKIFAGEVITPDNFKSWQTKAVAYGDTLNADTLVVISPVKVIQQEYRFFIVDGVIVAGSSYKVGNRVITGGHIDADVKQYTLEMMRQWRPDIAYVMDIARTPDGFKIIEFNCLNGSGFYAADCILLVESLSRLIKYKDYTNYTTESMWNEMITSPIAYKDYLERSIES